jgi:hypothetical protein
VRGEGREKGGVRETGRREKGEIGRREGEGEGRREISHKVMAD